MSEPKHTAGPWYQYNYVNKTKGSGQMICTDSQPKRKFGKDDEYSAPFIICQTGLYTSPKREEAEANAEYIVRACNAFPDLLEALKECVACAYPNPTEHPTMTKAWECAKAAIAKAQPEGKQ